MRTISDGQLVSGAYETHACFSALVVIPSNGTPSWSIPSGINKVPLCKFAPSSTKSCFNWYCAFPVGTRVLSRVSCGLGSM